MNKANLILNSLLIEGFRAFKRLEIERLGRVNLIVGKNSVGKTALLEALMIYACQGRPSALLEVLSNRQEFVFGGNKSQLIDYPVEDLKYLFYQWPEIHDDLSQHRFRISQFNPHQSPLFVEFDAVEVALMWQERWSNKPTVESLDRSELSAGELVFHISNRSGEVIVPPTLLRAGSLFIEGSVPQLFVSSFGISAEKMGEYWDNIALTDLDVEITEAARIIHNKIDRINLINKGTNLPNSFRVPYAKVGSQRVPLQSLGEGASRIFGLALALANAANGILLVDEIESGLHFSVQHQMWEMIFQLADRLNAQVFATTHSDDCVAAFQAVAEKYMNIEGELIRLEVWNGEHKAILFDEERLELAIREGVDVR